MNQSVKPRFSSMQEVPANLQKLKHSQLSLAQIEGILSQADASDEPFSVALGHAQRQFAESHIESDGIWVIKSEDNKEN